MNWVPELMVQVWYPDGSLKACWMVSRRFRPGTYWVITFGQWGTPGWVKTHRNYSAVVNDFGHLVQVPT